MDELSLALGITGTGGVIIAFAMYLVSKGVRSKCLAAKMEMSFDVHQVDSSQEKRDQSISNLTRADLEEIIVDVLTKHRRSSVGFAASNIIVPNIVQNKQPSLREIEEMIKDTIHDTVHGTPSTRSRSGSEDSHRSHKSHKSHHSKGKDDHIIILREEM